MKQVETVYLMVGTAGTQEVSEQGGGLWFSPRVDLFVLYFLRGLSGPTRRFFSHRSG